MNAFSALTSRSATSAVTLNKNNPAFDKAKELSRFKINGIELVRKSEVATGSKHRNGSSPVWQYGETLIRVSDKVKVYYCYECESANQKQRLPVLNGTTGARQHMAGVHKRDPDSGQVTAAPESKGKVFTLVNTADFDLFKELLIRWFVFCQLALFMLENLYFRELVKYLNKGLGGLLPKSSKTLRNWIIEYFEKQKELVALDMSFSKSRIHISFDIWTAGSFLGFISIWGYWIDGSGDRQRRLLAFRRIYGSHSGENQSAIILKVLQEYSIQDRLGYVVADNASSNDAAVELLLTELQPDATQSHITNRRLRCFGHIINLAAQSLLAGSDSEYSKASQEVEVEPEEEEFHCKAARWIHSGPLGKLQRLIKYVLASPQRREEFGEVSGGRKVAQFDHLGVSEYRRCCSNWRCWK
jgi:hypothetical protein